MTTNRTTGSPSSSNPTTDNPALSPTMLERDPRLLLQEEGMRGVLGAGLGRLRSGDLGSLPVIIGLIVVWVAFQVGSQNKFFIPSNIEDLSAYISFGGLITLGIVLVLLLGEIDLSVGSMSGLTAAIVAVLNVQHGWQSGIAVLVGVVIAAALGAFQGYVFDRFNVPSFVVTLAGLLAWYGLQLKVLGSTGTINFSGGLVEDFLSYHFPTVWSYVIVTAAIVAYIAAMAFTKLQQSRAGLPSRPWSAIVIRAVIVAAATYLATVWLNRDLGLNLAFVMLLAFCVVFALFTTRTTYGRHIFAVGGNIEAARRAGINVRFIRISVFAIAGAMAGLGGVVNASYVSSASQSSGGNTLLLFSIAAAVIGGTSLFGGRGSAWSALLGWLVVGSIYKGIYLVGLSASAQNLIVGGVLAAAAVVDALARRGRQSHGKA